MFNFLKTLSLLFIFPLIGVAQLSGRQTRNLEAFSKIYGYVRYFHPSDESGIETWDDIAINGSRLMLSVKDDEQLIQELNNIYLPIAPSLKIYPSAQKLKFDVKDITPSDLSNYKEISWQHLGLALYGWEEKRSYYSIKLNRRSGLEQRDDYNGNLIPEIDISKNKGAFYNFNVSLNLSGTFAETVKLQLLGIGADSTVQQIVDDKDRRYTFRAFVPDSTRSISFALKSNLEIPLSVHSVTVTLDTSDNAIKPALDRLIPFDRNQSPGTFLLQVITNDRPLYNERLQIGEHINKTIVPGINIIMPLVLYGNGNSTYPSVDSTATVAFKIFNKRIARYNNSKSLENKEVALADIIILWNILRHSFPYWSDVKVSSEKILRTALQNASSAGSIAGFLQTVEMMCSSYNDAHMFISISDLHRDNYLPPIYLTNIGKAVIVKDMLSDDFGNTILPGDQVLSVDGLSSNKRIDSSVVFFSGSREKKESLSMLKILEGKKDSEITLKIQRGKEKVNVKLKRNSPSKYVIAGNSGYLQKDNCWLDSNVYYFDLTKNTLDWIFRRC